ncbi:MAG TPA: universal stress protein [Anaerolineales bacterium]|nr:universal stress protein [Anaerolineales bacterium]
MSVQKPLQILCAVRGGRESRQTVTRAIDLALEARARLTFFHVMDAEFLEYATIGPLSVVYNELREMGEFAMLILCDRAQRRGVENVDYIVREGNIRKQLKQIAIETRAEIMVIGRPTRSPGRNVFRSDDIEDFSAELAEIGNLRTILVP